MIRFICCTVSENIGLSLMMMMMMIIIIIIIIIIISNL